MCEPITIALGVAAVVGGVMSATAQMQAGKAAAAQARFQGQVADANAFTAGVNAEDALDRGEIAEQALRDRVEAVKGHQRAHFAGRGIVVGEGSALTVLEDTAMLGELDARTIRSNAEREAAGWMTRSNNYLSQAQMFRVKASESIRAGRMGALGTLVSTAASVGGSFIGAGGNKGGQTVMGSQFRTPYRNPATATFL